MQTLKLQRGIIVSEIDKYIQGGPQKCPYFSLAITFVKEKRKTSSRFFLHRSWKFIEFFWWKHPGINSVLLYFFSN